MAHVSTLRCDHFRPPRCSMDGSNAPSPFHTDHSSSSTIFLNNIPTLRRLSYNHGGGDALSNTMHSHLSCGSDRLAIQIAHGVDQGSIVARELFSLHHALHATDEFAKQLLVLSSEVVSPHGRHASLRFQHAAQASREWDGVRGPDDLQKASNEVPDERGVDRCVTPLLQQIRHAIYHRGRVALDAHDQQQAEALLLDGVHLLVRNIGVGVVEEAHRDGRGILACEWMFHG
mmetsp:Transcript_8385/g.22694  ORF Transcript_8385/g.22694 Transcript_8385/m.22694 type:complete len:231 (-) Transcript_8385:39-731(-)